MSDERLHKQKFKVEQWPTSKVTLYPTRASIVRQIEGVQLKAGLNEITISDLSSAADHDSVRVSGTTDNHPARINDLTIDLVPNTHSNSYDSSDTESEPEEEEDEEPSSLKAAQENVEKVQATLLEVKERQESAKKELALLETYADAMAGKKSPDPKIMKETLEVYNNERAAHFKTITECNNRVTELEKERKAAIKLLDKEKRAFAKSIKGKVEERKKKKAERDERRREKRESKQETSPLVYRVRITIELPSSDISAGKTESNAESAEVFQEAKLTLTYTTTSASWTPHYDLRLDTTKPSLSTLTYRAHFVNRTYETWSHAAITLSTSEASFGGLKEKIPQMEGWRVTLAKKWNTESLERGENGLYSLAELKAKNEAQQKEYGHGMVGLQQQHQQRMQMAQSSSIKYKKQPVARAAVFEAPMASAPPPPPTQAAPGSGQNREESDEDMGMGLFDDEDDDGETVAPGGRAMQHSLAGSDTYGFTTTYELPTPRTIPSSPLIRRHVIAEISLPSLVFTHIVIPKLKAAAFLKARLKNTSSVPLLPGPAGMTLDGSYMGTLNFPRCSPSETVVLELGVDQGVKVEYERPTVKHGTQGMMIMGKEEVGAFKRSMRITNSKSSTVSLVVLDQVPVPEDERLKVNILVPKGLRDVDGVVKNVGVDAKTYAKGAKKPPASGAAPPSPLEDIPETASVKSKPFNFNKRDSTFGSVSKASASSPTTPTVTSADGNTGSGWGTAKATLKKNGEVRWDVDLNKGGSVALALEWECRMPSGEGVNALS